MTTEYYNPLASNPTQVERIYITRGDNVYNDAGVKCDKMIGLMMQGKIHWLDDSVADINEVCGRLANFNVSLSSRGTFGSSEENGDTYFDKKVTKIKHHHDDMFSDKYSYNKLTMKTPSGSYWWDWTELRDTYFKTEAAQLMPT